MSDLIDRQAAIDEGMSYINGDCFYDKEDFAKYIEFIEQLPPIQSAEPKRGRWILDRSGAYCCSECMEPCAGYLMMKPRDKFCKMCGSRNEVTT